MNCIYTCQETCKQLNPCGNIHCSANPEYVLHRYLVIRSKKKVEQNRSVKPLERV